MLRELWCRLAATALTQPLACEPPYATGAPLERPKKKKVSFFLKKYIALLAKRVTGGSMGQTSGFPRDLREESRQDGPEPSGAGTSRGESLVPLPTSLSADFFQQHSQTWKKNKKQKRVGEPVWGDV